MNFASDNWAGVTPAVMAAILRHNEGFAPAYGGDEVSAAVRTQFSRVFEKDVEVFFTGTGTAANALAMAACARPGGLILASADAHLANDEYGASEFFTGGMKPVAVPTRNGLMDAAGLGATLAKYREGGRGGEPRVLSLTLASEAGTLYRPATIAALGGLAHERAMAVHMDGARFANGVAGLGASPAEITWKAGVDLMSFGGTKNGCLAAEAIVVFEPGRWPDLAVLRARAGQTFSKARFIAAQFEGYLADDGWLETAAHANAMAARLADGIAKSAHGRVGWPAEANEVFAILPKPAIAALRAAGAAFHAWPDADIALAPDEEMVRLVTSFATSRNEVDRFLALL